MRAKGKKIAIIVGAIAVVAIGATSWLYRAHIQFLWLFQPLGNNEQGYPEYRHRRTGIVMVWLPAGTFMMGAPEDEKARHRNEGPAHEVSLSSFMIAKHEATQAEWVKVMGKNPSHFKGENRPVENVSWHDCKDFCKKTGLLLPSEAQWEYSCRAMTKSPHSGAGSLDEIAWFSQNSGNKTHPVCEKDPNNFGLYDTHGNVWEWCEDMRDEEFYLKPEASKRDPICTSGPWERVARGGCWGDSVAWCRSACRGKGVPSDRRNYLGFRPAFYATP